MLTDIRLEPWAESRIRLKYLLGEYLVRDIRLPAYRYRTPFPPPDGFDASPESVLASCPHNRPLVVLESWPFTAPEPRIRTCAGRLRYIPSIQPRYFVSLAGTFDEYLKSNFGAKPRKNLLRSVRKLKEASPEGELDFRIYRSPAEIGEFLSAAIPVSRLTYQSRMLGVGLPETSEFRDKVLEYAAEGSVRGYILYHAGKPIAFVYCTATGSTLYYSVIGYDPSFAEWSPGTVLLYLILEHLFAEARFSHLDFGLGEAQYKSMFSTGSQTCGDVYYFPPSLRNRVIIYSHRAFDEVSTFGGRMLRKLGQKDKLRKLLRRRSSDARTATEARPQGSGSC